MIISKKWLNSHQQLGLLVAGFLLTHFLYLTRLPIFNDEAIYLHWGWIQTHFAGHAFDSLFDAKQPLLIWIFGLVQALSFDPLWLGRAVCVLFGLGTLLGIYFLTKKLFNSKIAFWAATLFAVTPIFVFYNRQALLEAAVACLGVWIFYCLLHVLQKPSWKSGALLGVLMAIGLMIKSSSLFFIATGVGICLFEFYKELSGKRKIAVVLGQSLLAGLVTFLAVGAILFTQPLFWQSFESNSRYALNFSELVHLPVLHWWKNIGGLLAIGCFFITPLVFGAALAGTALLAQQLKHKKQHQQILFWFYFGGALSLELLTVRVQSQRYLVSFLPFIVIPAAYFLNTLWQKVVWGKILGGLTLLPAVVLSLLILFSPLMYIAQLQKVSRFADKEYLQTFTTGQGITEAVAYLQQQVQAQKSLVLVGLNTGNPENAVAVYTRRDSYLYTFPLDQSYFEDLANTDCLTASMPVYLVTRDYQLLGFNRYFTLEKKFTHPDDDSFVGIYTLKKECRGKTLDLDTFYLPLFQTAAQYKK